MIPPDAYERAVTLLAAAESVAATRTEPWDGGTAYFNSDYPKKYAQNYLRLDADAQLDAQTIIREAERVQGGAGLEHRRVNGYGSNLQKLARAFEDQGWQTNRLLFMGHDRDAAMRSTPSTIEVRHQDLNEIRDLMIRWDLEEDANPRDVAEMLADSRTPYVDAGLLTFFVGLRGGEEAGFCELWQDATTAQIENVMTFSQHRNAGVASAVIRHALEHAYGSGAGFCFLIADDNDWPKELYGRLGFEPIGYMWEYTKIPG